MTTYKRIICLLATGRPAFRWQQLYIENAGLNKHQRPKLLSDNGTCYIASELKEYLKAKGISQVHGKIERYHRSMKNVVKLDHYYCLKELNAALETFVHYYDYHRYHESLDNVTPADVYLENENKS